MSDPPFREKKSLFADQRFENSTLTVRLAGPNIGNREAPIISDEVLPSIDALGKGKWLRHVVVDLSQVSFMSSVGLGLCINIRNRAAATGSKAILYGLNAELKKVMMLMKIDRLFTVVEGRDALAKATA